MKNCLIILLSLAISLQAGREAFIGLWYEVNKSRITELFCVNKDKVEMQCDGKCHLAKMLEETDDPASEQPRRVILEDHLPFLVFFKKNDGFFSNKIAVEDKPHFSYRFHYFFQPAFRVFHPPK